MTREFHLDRTMRGERETRAWDAVVAVIAARQHGVISRPRLIRIGLSDDEIDRRIQAGRLHPLHRGVYAVGHRNISREGRYIAAVLFAGEGAVLSHRAAADVWELRASRESRIDVIAPAHRRGDAEVRIRQDQLDPSETTRRHGIRVTKPLRTPLDLAAVVSQKELERAIRQAVYRRLTTTALLADAVHERAGRRGAKSMRIALVHLGEAPGQTRSDLEDDFLVFLRKHRLPMPELNVKTPVGEVDCMWPEQRLIVELDGRDAHDTTPAFETDRERDAALQAAGWRVIRITSRRMRHDAKRLAGELRTILR